MAAGTVAMLAGCTGDDEIDLSGDVNVYSHRGIGDILVGPEGLTLYMFDLDSQGDPTSACYDDCATNWSPLTVMDDPTTGEGVTATLSTFERDDGENQVAANGWPLYYFAADGDMGDIEGQGVEGVWWVLDTAGVRKTRTPPPGGGGGPY